MSERKLSAEQRRNDELSDANHGNDAAFKKICEAMYMRKGDANICNSIRPLVSHSTSTNTCVTGCHKGGGCCGGSPSRDVDVIIDADVESVLVLGLRFDPDEAGDDDRDECGDDDDDDDDDAGDAVAAAADW